jgi:hypothetical protein
MPERIQLRRVKGWRKPEGAVVVSRPTRWGNPIRITRERLDRWPWTVMYRVHGSPMDLNGGPSYCVLETARHFAARFFEWDLLNGRYGDVYPSVEEIQAELAGRDLACWCPLATRPSDYPSCHADVLLDVANREA